MSAENRRVVITQRFFDEATIDYLQRAGCEVVQAELPAGEADGNLSHAELVDRLEGAAGWIVGHARVTRDLMADLPDLRIISRRGVGYERIDLAAAAELGKIVCIAVGGNHESVADHALALMLAVGHRVREAQANMIGGNWSILLGNDLYRKTVGIIGLGRIGRSVVRRLQGFEPEILALGGAAPDAEFAARTGVTFVTFEALLARSDYVTLHAPLTPATRLLIGKEALSRMKASAYLINTARGGLVDDGALLGALRAGEIAGAGLDVYLSESDPALKPVTRSLIELPNVIATPHSGASSQEGIARTNMVAARSVVAVLDGGTPAEECLLVDGR